MVFRLMIVLAFFFGISTTQNVTAAKKSMLPLQIGIYVPEEVECPKLGSIDKNKYAFNQYPESAIAIYGDGFGSNDGNCFSYNFTHVTKKGNIFIIKGDVITGAGGHNMGDFDMTISVNSTTSFSVIKADGILPYYIDNNKKKIIRYRYCGNPDNIKYPLE